jgi:nanoRNase/pAp phosphatase (c-di-AMP/oligoRNAs hydrolase)
MRTFGEIHHVRLQVISFGLYSNIAMNKENIKNIRQKNAIIGRIIDAMAERKNFLLCGHKNPDEDCVSSMVAMAILLIKFDKVAQIYINGHVPENIGYLLSICRYNSISVFNSKGSMKDGVDTVIICDTPKRSMLDISPSLEKIISEKSVVKIEIDHHIGGDGEYIGDMDFCLVTEASSTCELIGILALKMRNRKDILSRFMVTDPFSRNFVLSIITGIVGDTNMGRFIKSHREKRLYTVFSRIYDDILMKTTVKASNFTRIDQVFNEIQKITEKEKQCYDFIIEKKSFSDSIGYIVMHEEDMADLYRNFDEETIISVTKAVANELAEQSHVISLVAFYDNIEKSDLIQFRMRRSHDFRNFDLRKTLEIFSIANGGGHEGAIGFRFPRKEISDLDLYVKKIISRLENEFHDKSKSVRAN